MSEKKSKLKRSEERYCPACKKQNKLKKNCHVIPSWCYSGLEDEYGNIVCISTRPESFGVTETGKNHVVGKFWCSACEKYSEKWDKRAKDQLIHNPKREDSHEGMLTELEYKFYVLQKFIYSVLIREYLDGLSRDKKTLIFSDSSDFEKILELYKDKKNKDFKSYPFMITLVDENKLPKAKDCITLPYNTDFDGKRAIQFFAVGHIFTLFLDDVSDTVFRKMLATPNQKLSMIHMKDDLLVKHFKAILDRINK